ncbi:MAG: FAD-dependent thymidylate synthase [Candidatus Kapabacteria bacterium]|nr:FAD-dependent thymidylate synthase [Candidatus Kapabacteria bacterium]
MTDTVSTGTATEPQLPEGNVITCLDKGFVRLVDYMGSDAAIVQAARVSYGAGTKKVSEDRGLIRYLMRHAHTTPFEMVEFKFHVKLPIFVARQWIRHRTANVNEYSGRYSVMPDEFYVPDAAQIRPQSATNKQGRAEETFSDTEASSIQALLQDGQQRAYNDYEKLLGDNFARELARINLPVSQYTEWYWKIDLHNLFHFLRLRIDAHAQYEIRVYADAMAQMVREIVPMAFEAFEDYTLNAVRLTKPEIQAMKRLLATTDTTLLTDEVLSECGLSKREMEEFRDKLRTMQP